MNNLEKLNLIFSDKLNLYNSKISKMTFEKKEFDNVIVKIRFSDFNVKTKIKSIEFVFSEIVEFSFYHQEYFNFLQVEDYKILELKGKEIFFSLDPDNSTSEYSELDANFIKCKLFEFNLVES